MLGSGRRSGRAERISPKSSIIVYFRPEISSIGLINVSSLAVDSVKGFYLLCEILEMLRIDFIVSVKGWHTRYQGTRVRDNTPRFRKISGNGLENRSVPKLGYQVVQSTSFSVLADPWLL